MQRWRVREGETMRLQEIAVKNFGRHSDTELDLSDIDLAAITGPNGAGKTTFFVEALLWVIKKKCRVAPGEIMKEGATDMSVRVVLLLNGKRYKVERTLSTRTKRGSSSLSFTVQNGDGWQPVGQDAQTAIDALIPSYELLTQTCFAVQGELDQFTRATPGDRKKVLAQILADYYARLKKCASDCVVELERKINVLDIEHVEANDQAEKMTAILADLKNNEEAKTCVLADIGKYQDSITVLNEQKVSIAATIGSVDEAQKRRSGLRETNEKLGLRKTELQTRQEDLDALILQGPVLKEQVERENEIRKQKEECDIAILQCSATLETIAGNVAEAKESKHQIDLLHQDLKAKQGELDAIVKAYQAETQQLRASHKRDEDEMQCLEGVPCDDTLQSQCPFTAKALNARQRHAENAPMLEARSTEESGIAVTLNLEGSQDEVKAINATLFRLEDQRTRTAIARERSQKAVTGYASQLSGCSDAAAQLVRVENAEVMISEVTNNLESVLREMTSVTVDIKAADEQIQQSDAARTRMQKVTTDIAEGEKELEMAREELSSLATARGAIDERQTRSLEAIARRIELTKTLKSMRVNWKEFVFLVEAYTTIPVLIIEASIPLLEHETNTVLERIASDGMQVKFNTQRALKLVDRLAETLDIVVQTYEREGALESFSGGERMRADLAIRIGLAKLLSQRAGASLELLVLDEATWAIDENSVPVICACIEKLSEEIQIFMITHRRSEVETLPCRIHFSKNGDGSAVEIAA